MSKDRNRNRQDETQNPSTNETSTGDQSTLAEDQIAASTAAAVETMVETETGVPVEVTVETTHPPQGGTRFKVLSVDQLNALSPEELAAYKIAFDQHEADRKAKNNSNYQKYKAKLAADPVKAQQYKDMKKRASAKHQAKQKAIRADLEAAKKRLEELTAAQG